MKKLIKNKYVLLISGIIIMSVLYFVVEKAIDNYKFQSNNDIITEDKVEESSDSDDITEDETENQEVVDDETLDDEIIETSENMDVSSALSSNVVDKESDVKIYVYVTGEVNNPGVVILKEGSRIIDAINATGGTTSNADITKINLVYVLEDGMKVNIPNNNDLKEKEDFEFITKNSGDGGDISSEKIEDRSSRRDEYEVVNINTATQTELETLPGIGPSIALKIINYRKENGKFSSIDDIKNVSGIGDNKFEELKNYIKV